MFTSIYTSLQRDEKTNVILVVNYSGSSSGSRNFGEGGPRNMKYKATQVAVIFLWLVLTWAEPIPDRISPYVSSKPYARRVERFFMNNTPPPASTPHPLLTSDKCLNSQLFAGYYSELQNYALSSRCLFPGSVHLDGWMDGCELFLHLASIFELNWIE